MQQSSASSEARNTVTWGKEQHKQGDLSYQESLPQQVDGLTEGLNDAVGGGRVQACLFWCHAAPLSARVNPYHILSPLNPRP